MIEAVCVDPKEVGKIWPTVSPLVRRAIDKIGFSSFDVVEKDVLNGFSLVWLAWDGEKILAAAVTQVHGDVCEICACAGSGLMWWRDLIGKLEDYGRAEGCARMRIIGRKGWARVLKKYSQPCIILERQL